jgi:hypothetical protein
MLNIERRPTGHCIRRAAEHWAAETLFYNAEIEHTGESWRENARSLGKPSHTRLAEHIRTY